MRHHADPRGSASQRLGLQGLVFAIYVLAGKLGLSLAFVHASASAVWPPTGIAIAALILTHQRLWPAIFAGAFVVNMTTSGAILISLGIAVGNTLEAVVAAWLVHRFARGADVFERAPDVFRYVLFAALLATAVSASVGVMSLVLGGSAPQTAFESIWLTWWLGDVAGALLVAPPILLWARRPRPGYGRERGFEVAFMITAAVALSLLVFGGALQLSAVTRSALSFLTVPPLIWAAFRFGPREASTLNLITAAIATWGTLQQRLPAAPGAPSNEPLLVLQAFLATVAAITLPTAALVAERARSQARLSESELAYRAMFEPNPIPMWVVDHDTMKFLAVNDAATARYGFTRQEFLSMTTIGIRPPEYLGQLDQARRRLFAEQRYVGLHRHRTKDGSVLDVEITAHVIQFGGRKAALIMAHDVTERLRTQERERKARADAEAANVAKDEFLATLSHELRTPLNAILGWVVMLRGGRLGPVETGRALETVERNVRHQARLIEDLLDVSRIVADKLTLEVRRLALPPVVRGAVDAMRLTAENKGVRVGIRVDPDTPDVAADAARLHQVVWNLVSNAVKFTPAGGDVVVRLRPGRLGAKIEVTDTGPGIAAEFLPHVFDRFRQADTTTTRRHGGLGLGLTIVRHLVAAHGGTVRADSDGPGRGATFTVELPAAAAAVRPAEPAASTTPRATLAGLRVLVVDDDDDNRALAATTLEQAGAAIVAVGSASDARATLSRMTFDAMVADIAMPEEDGYVLIRHVRASPATRTLPAVAFTAFGGRDARRRLADAGYDAHVAKPVTPSELVEAVGTAVKRRTAS
jgi:PAS domain S-box-containing protein